METQAESQTVLLKSSQSRRKSCWMSEIEKSTHRDGRPVAGLKISSPVGQVPEGAFTPNLLGSVDTDSGRLAQSVRAWLELLRKPLIQPQCEPSNLLKSIFKKQSESSSHRTPTTNQWWERINDLSVVLKDNTVNQMSQVKIWWPNGFLKINC